jgi:hypothetical protein
VRTQIREISKKFWDLARQVRMRDIRRTITVTQRDLQHDSDLMSFGSASEHIIFLKAERDRILSSNSPLNNPLPNLVNESYNQYITRQLSVAPVFDRPSEKKKVKSRITERTSFEEEIIRLPQISSSSPKTETITRIKVSPRSKRILLRMFPSSIEEFGEGSLHWNKFVEARKNAGFAAVNSSGSAVVFIKDGQGRIVFHRPRPADIINQIMLRSWGRRMKKWFHWDRETFLKDIWAYSFIDIIF